MNGLQPPSLGVLESIEFVHDNYSRFPATSYIPEWEFTLTQSLKKGLNHVFRPGLDTRTIGLSISYACDWSTVESNSKTRPQHHSIENSPNKSQ